MVVPQARVRTSFHSVDPVSTAIRRSIAIRRRVYCVEGPNSLWHIDGHHKLIRWIVYLSCSTNNEVSTLLLLFTDAISKHGVPEQVRSNLGGKNIQIWRYMVATAPF